MGERGREAGGVKSEVGERVRGEGDIWERDWRREKKWGGREVGRGNKGNSEEVGKRTVREREIERETEGE